MKSYIACVALALAAAPCVAAESSWDGTWKVNVAKTHIPGEVLVVEDKGNGLMRIDDGISPYDLACDGKPYTVTGDRTDTCTGSVEAGYDDVIREGDKVVATQHSTLSPDGKTWTVRETDITADGKSSTRTAVYDRLSGTRGVFGKWSYRKPDRPSNMTFVIQRSGDWIKMSSGNAWSIEGKTDGSSLSTTGLDLEGAVATMKAEGPNRLHETFGVGSKFTSESTYTLSGDGKTITVETWTPGKEREKWTVVWERQ